MERHTFDTWRLAARPLLAAAEKAEGVNWRERLATVPTIQGEGEMAAATPQNGAVRLSRSLMQLLANLACFRHESRWELMYRLAWRTLFENPRLLEDAADGEVGRAFSMDRAVRRDIHKMHAFVRFRECPTVEGDPAYFAWFQPQHLIVRAGAIFFVERFRNMRWTIATPDGAALWDQSTLQFVESLPVSERPSEDRHEDLWRTYYRSICNVARINPLTMRREMPQHYWRNLPEARDIGSLITDGAARFAARHHETDLGALSAAKAVHRSIAGLPARGEGPNECRRCEIWKHATQAVEGEGPPRSAIMLVGEQPGDEEDLRGRPFVGPAGRVLDAALAEAGIDRNTVYVTNAVKHFKWEPRGKRRLHKKPNTSEIDACHVWLEREIVSMQPRVLVALGASALRALSGSASSIDSARHQILMSATGIRIIATYHPSAILRAIGDSKAHMRAALVDDLRRAIMGPSDLID